MSAERHLWLMVIFNAIKEATSSKESIVKESAANWLKGNSRDFAKVCDYAGVHPDKIRKAYREVNSGRKMLTYPENTKYWVERRKRNES